MEEDTTNYKLVKKLKIGGKSEFVYLLENSTGHRLIKKKYSESDPIHLQHFKNELEILDHLKDCSFVPKIHKVDKSKNLIYMNYCGKSLELLNNEQEFTKSENFKYKRQIKRLMKKLEEKYGVKRVIEDKVSYKVNYNNVCRKNGKLSLIDFGSLYWQIADKS